MKHLFAIILVVFCLLSLSSGGQINPAEMVEQYLENAEPPLPMVEPVINERISDVIICKDNAGQYYLTGSGNDFFSPMTGIRVWQSSDMKSWKLLGDNGFVWTINRDGKPWLKKILNESAPLSSIIRYPKIYFLNNNFWISFSIGPLGSSQLMRSTTGKAQGPYQEVKDEGPKVDGINATLFESADSSIWCIWGKGYAQKIDPQNGGFIQGTRLQLNLPISYLPQSYNLSLIEGKTYLTFPQWQVSGIERIQMPRIELDEYPAARFDAMYMVASSISGSFSMPRLLLPHGGNCQLYTDFSGIPRAMVSNCIDNSSPFRGNPVSISLSASDQLWLVPKHPFPIRPDSSSRIIYVSKDGNNSNGNSWQNAYQGIQKAIDNSENNTQIWISQGKYDAPVRINLKNGIYIYGGFVGNETNLDQRDFIKNKVVIDGRKSVPHVFFISGSSYIRLDGLTIRGGEASGSSYNNRYGGGLNLLGGGETVRIVNCNFTENSADQDGGAIYLSLGASPIILNCSMTNNHSKNNGGAIAIYCNSYNGYHTQIYNCTIIENSASQNGGAIYFDSDRPDAGLISLINCIVAKNKTSGTYGTIALDRNSRLLMNHCTVAMNMGVPGGTVVGRLGRIPSNHRIVNSIFFKNEGGHLFNIEGDVTIENDEETTWVKFENNLFSGNLTDALVRRNFDGASWLTVEELNDCPMGIENIGNNPLYNKLLQDDFRLTPDSDARNKGTSFGAFPFNIEGKLRMAIPNTGPIDLGAY